MDDHAVVRSGLRMLMDSEEGLETVAEAGNAQDAIFEVREHNPDVVLMDVVLPGQERDRGDPGRPQGIARLEGAGALHGRRPELRPGGLRGGRVRVRPEGGCRHGARRSVAAGGRRRALRPPGARGTDGRRRGPGAARAEEDPLSEREREVLRLLALGHTNQEIAKMLFISVRTAETHRAHIMQKLRLGTRAELVRYALAQGLLEE